MLLLYEMIVRQAFVILIAIRAVIRYCASIIIVVDGKCLLMLLIL